jgi:hypothetical protein
MHYIEGRDSHGFLIIRLPEGHGGHLRGYSKGFHVTGRCPDYEQVLMEKEMIIPGAKKVQ